MKSIIIPGTKKYYKYKDTPWVQPTLTSNGTMGGPTMAVSRHFSGNTYTGGNAAFECFLPHGGNANVYGDEFQTWIQFHIYIPTAIRITSCTVRCFSSGDAATSSAYGVTLWGGNSAGDLKDVLAGLGTVGEGSSKTVTVSTNSYYNYYAIRGYSGGYAYEDRVFIGGIKLAGVYTEMVETTPEDATVILDTSKIMANYREGKYYGM